MNTSKTTIKVSNVNKIPQLQIVIPCYNEAENLRRLFDEMQFVSRAEKSRIQFVLVNNGSTDHTRGVLEKITHSNEVKVVHLDSNQGYGGGILAGLEACEADYIGWTHADGQTPLTDLIFALNLIQANDCLFIKGKRVNRPLVDRFFSIGMGIFETVLFGKKLWEINAQPTILDKRLFESWENPPLDFSLDLFALHGAVSSRTKVIRFPVKFENRLFGQSSWNLGFKSRAKFIKRAVIYSLHLRFHY